MENKVTARTSTSQQPSRGISTQAKRCDLVLLTWNHPELLKMCVEHILASTQLPSRLIIVDNGSTDPEVLAYLATLKGTAWVEPLVVRRPHNVGIATALNTGLAHTSAPWICVLNNDIVVTEGWLSEMIRVAEAHPYIGLVNPISNEWGLAPHPGESIDDVARQCHRWRGQWIESAKCVGFCMLLPRRVLQHVGYLDEDFQFMYFEDADYALRVRKAGYDCAIAKGAYVYHHGGATLKWDPERKQRFRDNEARFYQKWHAARPQRIACVLAGHPTSDSAWLAAGDLVRELANEDHKVWVFGPWRVLKRLPRHINVVAIALSGPLGPIRVLWRVLAKKKRFHQIILRRGWMAHLLRFLQPLHTARIVIENG